MPQSRKRPTSKGRRPSPQTYQNKQTAAPKGKDKKTQVIAGVVIAALLAAGLIYFLTRKGGGNQASGNEVTTASGLKYVDIVEGTGPTPQVGQTVVVHYTGTLQNGTKFDSSLDKGQPFSFPIGRGSVIKGWDEGLMTMKVGGKRRLIIPPKLGYGAQAQAKIPANSTLIFEVEMLGIK
jgi:hypothetical protein